MREKEFLPLIKEKLGIEELNPMQERMMRSASDASDIILLSPTGSGKTLAFILPTLKMLRPSTGRVQCVVIAPSRELVMQIAGVFRSIARDFKVTALYGGHKVEDEVNSLSVVPDVIVATPGRLLDHIRRRNIDVLPTRILVLDEFDKSLELGFEDEMSKIVGRLKNVSRTILTSATDIPVLPDFIVLDKPLKLDFLGDNKKLRRRIGIHRVNSDGKDKLNTLYKLLCTLYRTSTEDRTIIFVNHRESVERVAEYLEKEGMPVALYHGGLDQSGREKAITLFNNGSRPVLVATDLAARGLDIRHVANIVHYHQPLTEENWTHRNGRTARVSEEGDIYVLVGPEEDVREFIDFDDTFYPDGQASELRFANMETLRFSAGKKEKLSKGDILGFLVKIGGFEPSEIGKIDVFDHYALAAVDASKAREVYPSIAKEKIKGKRQKIEFI